MIKLRLNNSDFRTLSAICITIGQIFFGAAVAAGVLPLDSAKLQVILFYLGFSILAWILAIKFAEKGKS